MKNIYRFQMRSVLLKKMIFIFFLQGISLSVYADSHICNDSAPIDGVVVVGDRSSSSKQSNRLFVILNDEMTSCFLTQRDRFGHFVGYQVRYGYIENTSPAYKSVLSIASAAFATQKNIKIMVDGNSDIDGVDETGSIVSGTSVKAFRIQGIRIE